MRYYEQDDRRGRRWAAAGVAVYFVLCVGVMFLTHTITLPEPEMGLLIDFGDGDTGVGEFDPNVGDVDVRPASPPVPPATRPPVITTDDPAVDVTVPEPRPAPQPVPPAPEPVPARQPDSRALFPGRTEGSGATSQGTAGGEGNQGSQEGSPGGSATEGGNGSSGGFSLAGRYLVGNLPRPAYNAEVEGRVVIRITVNAAGAVTGAVYEQAGSTTNHGELVSAARVAALRARFTPDEAAEVQTGTITYIFRLN
ncbi:MAG: TonB family protein [Alistipes sp.]|jgi:TonB family protein|nr:TonB family protein [Alistipes sp.]